MSTPSKAHAPQTRITGAVRDASEAPVTSAGERLDWLAGSEAPSDLTEKQTRKRYRLSILDRYLLGEIAAPFAFAVAAFTLFMVVNTFFLAADYIINKSVPFGLVMRYIVLQIPSFVYLILPFATLFGVSAWYVAGRIYGGNTLKTICRLSLSRDTCV